MSVAQHVLHAFGIALAGLLVPCCGRADLEPPAPGPDEPLSAALSAAIESSLASVRGDARDERAWLELGMTYEANALDHLAERTFASGTKLAGSEPRLPYHLARLLAQRGDFEGALTASDEALRRDSDYAPTQWRRGDWLLSMGRLEEARSAFRIADGLDPANPAGAWGLARAALESGDGRAALDALDTRSGHTPDYAYTHHLRASAYRATGDAARAEKESRLAGQPVWIDPWRAEIDRWRVGFHGEVERAKAAMMRRDLQTAETILEGLLEGSRDDVNVYGMLSDVYLARGDLAEARTLLEEARRRFPDHYRVALNLADVHERARDTDLALEEIEACLALHPTYAPAHMRHGRLLLKKGDAAGAVVALERARTLGETDLQLVQTLGVAHARTGRWDLSAAVFAEGGRLFPDSVDVALMEAEAHAHAGAEEAAEQALVRAESAGGASERTGAVRSKVAGILGEREERR